MPIVRRSRRLSSQTLPDPLDQYAPGGFDYLNISDPVTEPLVGYPVATAGNSDGPLSPQTIEHLCAFADQRELALPDLHSQCRRRKGKNGNAPRPPNAFMLFRSDFWRFNKERIPERDHRQISRIAAHCWNALEEPRRVPYQELARKLKDEHAQLYPQHKYNLSAKDRGLKKVKKEDTDNDELCGVIAARVAQDVRASRSPKTSGSSEDGGLFDQIAEQKVNLKRPRSASVAERASRNESQPSQPPAKKRKRNPPKSSIAAVPVPVGRPQANSSPSSNPPFGLANEALVWTIPSSYNSPAVEAEVVQQPVLEAGAQIVAAKMEPSLSPSKVEPLGLEFPNIPTSVSPSLPPFHCSPPQQYVPLPADAVVDKGLEFSDDYGLSRPTEGLDFDAVSYLGDAYNDYPGFEFAQFLL